MNTLTFTDEQLKLLNDIIRQHEIKVSCEQLTLIKMGKLNAPITDLTALIGMAWEKRQAELKNTTPEVSQS